MRLGSPRNPGSPSMPPTAASTERMTIGTTMVGGDSWVCFRPFCPSATYRKTRRTAAEGIKGRQACRDYGQQPGNQAPLLYTLPRISSLLKSQRRVAPRERHGPYQEGGESPGQPLADAAHLKDIELPSQGVHYAAGAQEEQRLEESMSRQVKHARRVGSDTHGQEHVADLADRRIGQDAL